ncbi:MAG: T9SS type A sorting domain-containing protein [Bacteroidetes bacterium]|nr:T9SS type A sorting domain-containing protein [Bacteroidota bacterium]
MSLRYTGSAGSMKLLPAILFLILGLPLLSGQLSHGCPYNANHVHDYENPLFERWLSAYDVKGYELSLSVSNISTLIDGSALILVEALRPVDTLVFELQDGLTVSSVTSGSDILDFEHNEGVVYIALEHSYQGSELIQVEITYGGDANQNRGFFAGISTRTDFEYDFDVTYTLSEPLNASDWFPAKQVLGDKIDSVTFRISCDKELMAGSNGILVGVTEEKRTHTFTWKTNYPMAYYLLSFAVAKYRDFSFYATLEEGGDSVLVQNFIYDSDKVFSDWEDGIRMTGPLISSFSGLISDYPFANEKYGHCMAPMGGGMEHQTMTTLQNFDFFLVAHELAHQWFGDYITCGNWQDIWINEGFASYLEYIAAQELLGQGAADEWMINAMSIARRETTGSVYVPEEQAEDTHRLFDYGLSYKKGAILLHMIRFILDDDEIFFRVLQSYTEEFGFGLARGADFQAILEAESDMDFSCFFDQWYYGEGFPRFKIYWGQIGDTLRLRSVQTTTAPDATSLFQVPFELDLILTEGGRKRIRLMQNENLEEYSIPVEGRVEDLIFDPDSHLLQTSGVIQELPVEKAYRLGPNPVSDKLFIQFPNAGPFEQVRITNLAGQEVLILNDMENPATMDLSTLADGPYLLELSNSRGTYQERIVKVSAN